MTGRSSVSPAEATLGGQVVYRPGFLERSAADSLLDVLWRELDWAHREIVLFGRRVMQPRLVAWYGDPGAVYRYSGTQFVPSPWHPALGAVRQRVEEATGGRYNAVLANAYRNGRDSMGWHSDDEQELGKTPLIASLSLGASRRFLLRSRDRGAHREIFEFLLEHGSLLLMQGHSQRDYQHSLPRTARDTGLRINLTYRWVTPQAPV